MKKSYKVIVILLFCIMLTGALCGCIDIVPDVSGNTEVSDNHSTSQYSEGFKYKVNPGIKTCTITGIGTCKDTDIIIPPEIDGYTVTTIGSAAFSSKKLSSVVIPDSVTKIENGAFSFCEKLTSVMIPNSVTEIGDNAFSGCTNLTNITIPNSVTKIGGSAFSHCTSLVSITIPESVTEIKAWVFSYCEGLSTITIPNSVTQIDAWAFSNCTGLSSIIIPDSVTKIGMWAFSDCTSLADVYYTGSEEDWEDISISTYNEYLTEATIHYTDRDE